MATKKFNQKTKPNPLEQLVAILNEETGGNYILDYKPIYGGYALYQPEQIRDYIHTDDRRTASEMQSYLQGLINGIRFIKHRIILTLDI